MYLASLALGKDGATRHVVTLSMFLEPQKSSVR